MFVNGNDLMERMMRLSANCRRCGKSIAFEKGAGLAKDKGIKDNVVMCTCGAVYTVHLLPSSMTLVEDVTQKYFPGGTTAQKAAPPPAPKPTPAPPPVQAAPVQPAPVQAASAQAAPAFPSSVAAQPQAALYQPAPQARAVPVGPAPTGMARFGMSAYVRNIPDYKTKGGAIAFWLLGMFGILNFHNFYLGKVKYGFIKLGVYFAMMILAIAMGSFSPALGNIIRLLMFALLASNVVDLVYIIAGMHGKNA